VIEVLLNLTAGSGAATAGEQQALAA
jgi:hypothetical protein